MALSQPVLYNHFRDTSQMIPPIAAAIIPFPKIKFTIPNMIDPSRAASSAFFIPYFSPSSFVTTYIKTVEIARPIKKLMIPKVHNYLQIL